MSQEALCFCWTYGGGYSVDCIVRVRYLERAAKLLLASCFLPISGVFTRGFLFCFFTGGMKVGYF